MENARIILNESEIGSVPVLTCYKENIRQAPVILFSHWFSGSRESYREDMASCAQQNFFTISIDNRGHGSRPAPHFRDYAMDNGKLNILKVRELINETARDIPGIIDSLAGNSAADIGRIAMFGISMGGFVTYRTLTLEKRIKAAAIFISSPFWDDFPDKVEQVDTPLLRGQVRQYAAANSPANSPGSFHNRPLFIQVGKEDNHFSLEKLRSFIKDIKPHNPYLEYIEYEKLGHVVTDEMKQKAFAWIAKVLSAA